MRFCTLLSLFFLVFSLSTASGSSPASSEDMLRGALLHLEKVQKKNDPLYRDGEWELWMKSYFLPTLIGVGTRVQEPSAFGTSSMLNLLASIYEIRPDLQIIPEMAYRALDSLHYYQVGPLFNFYNGTYIKGRAVRLPRDPKYLAKYLLGFTNIPCDADTTSVSMLAKLRWDNSFVVPQETFESFSQHRDIRRSPHYHNWLLGHVNTHAFLTWQWDEKNELSLLAPPEAGTRIPLGRNDVDCVVNSNVMALLGATKNTQLPGYRETCNYLNNIYSQRNQGLCGIYYPNAYYPLYAISNAYAFGATCLEKSKNRGIKFILENQKLDGSWQNDPGMARIDKVQSTALAVLALFNYQGENLKNDQRSRIAIYNGVRFLMKKAHKKNQEYYWDGEVFFSAVAQARNTVLWRSQAYTTALASLALAKAQKENLVEY